MPAPLSNSTPRAAKGGRSRSAPPAEEHAEKALFLRFLTGKQLKLTRQREAVVDEILGSSGHFEAEEIVQRLKRKRVRASRATVYRTLELLLECQLVERLELGGSGAYYEHTQLGEHHDHLICTSCGNVIEFHNAKLEALQTEICKGFDFVETHHSLRIFGLCGECRKGGR